jgi:hypothetical protein
VRVKIPAVDAGFVATGALALALSLARERVMASALATADPVLPLLASATLLTPLAFAAFLLWNAALLRATNWRRVAARAVVVLLGALSSTTLIASVIPGLPWFLVLSPRVGLALFAALCALAAAAYATSPARQRQRPRR